MDRHVEFFGKLDAAAVHHACAQTSQLEHLVVADASHHAGLGQDARVGGVDAVDVGIDFASVGPQHGGQGHRGGVAAAAPQGGDVVVVVDPLKAGSDDDLACVERGAHPLGRNLANPRLGVRAVGLDADLRPGHAHCLVAQRLDRHRHQRHAHLLARREQHIHLARRRVVVDLVGQVDQHVGAVPHGADDHHHLVAVLMGANRLPRRGQNLFTVGNAGAAELLHNQRHGRKLGMMNYEMNFIECRPRTLAA